MAPGAVKGLEESLKEKKNWWCLLRCTHNCNDQSRNRQYSLIVQAPNPSRCSPRSDSRRGCDVRRAKDAGSESAVKNAAEAAVFVTTLMS